jgi:hypothetical protein
MVRAMLPEYGNRTSLHARTFTSELGMLGQLFPERIFSRKLNPSADKRLRLAQARAEESIVQSHVENALMFVDNLAEDLPFDRAIETYVRVMGIPEPLASTVVTRTLVVLGEDLVPYHRRNTETARPEETGRPPLRLDDASDARVRTIRRA